MRNKHLRWFGVSLHDVAQKLIISSLRAAILVLSSTSIKLSKDPASLPEVSFSINLWYSGIKWPNIRDISANDGRLFGSNCNTPLDVHKRMMSKCLQCNRKRLVSGNEEDKGRTAPKRQDSPVQNYPSAVKCPDPLQSGQSFRIKQYRRKRCPTFRHTTVPWGTRGTSSTQTQQSVIDILTYKNKIVKSFADQFQIE